jgi:uncharacterized membrane-anchored protein YitT (DUF2179 family)
MAKIILSKLTQRFREFFMVILGIFVSSFGLKSFLIPNGFIDGGITGISLLISFLTPLNVSILIFVLNIPFILLAKKQVGKIFAVKTSLAILGLSIFLFFVDFPSITHDKLLVSIFGGFFIGAGIGLSLRGGAVLDGTEILSIYLNKKIGFSVGEIIFFFNAIIFSFATIFLGIEVALYSILTYVIASKVIDFVSQGIEGYKGLTIISSKNKEIRKKLLEMGKGVTIYNGENGSDEGKEVKILFTVINRLEVFKIKNEIFKIDSSSLIIESNVFDFEGGIIKKRRNKIEK